MKKIEENFIYKGVTFKVIKRGKNAIMLDAKSNFLTSRCIEVWQIRESQGSVINGNVIEPHEKKPSDNDYPYYAHQFLESHFKSFDEMMNKVNKRFDEYELGIRPKKMD